MLGLPVSMSSVKSSKKIQTVHAWSNENSSCSQLLVFLWQFRVVFFFNTSTHYVSESTCGTVSDSLGYILYFFKIVLVWWIIMLQEFSFTFSSGTEKWEMVNLKSSFASLFFLYVWNVKPINVKTAESLVSLLWQSRVCNVFLRISS